MQGVSGAGPASKVRSPGQTRSFWPVAMGEYKNRASRQVQGVSGDSPASNMRSPLQSRSFWPVAMGEYESRASL